MNHFEASEASANVSVALCRQTQSLRLDSFCLDPLVRAVEITGIKFNTDELRSGLSTIAGTYHSLIISETQYPDESKYHDAIHRIHKAMGSLGLNVNEELLLQSLFLHCPSLMTRFLS